MNLDKAVEILKVSQKLYNDQIQYILDFQDPKIKSKQLVSYSTLLGSLIHSVGQKGHGILLFSINYHLVLLLGPRMRVHQFSQKNLDEQSETYFEHFKDLNTAMDRLSQTHPDDILQQIHEIEVLLKEPLPMITVSKTTMTAKQRFQIDRYFDNYLTTIADMYESFVSLSLYNLFLFQLLEGKDGTKVDRLLKDLVNGKKLSIHQFYTSKKKSQKEEKLLRDYLETCTLSIEHKQVLMTLFDHIFVEEGIRELRNKRIHHFGETDSLILVDSEYVEATFSSGNKKRYSLSDIHQEKINLQFLVSLGFMILNSAMFSALEQIFEKEEQKSK